MADEKKAKVAPKTSKPKKATTKKVFDEAKEPFEKRPDLKKVCFYMVIVNFGQGQNIVRLFKNNHSSVQFIQTGEGTASKQIRSILSIEENRKEIIYSLIREDYVPEIKRELDAYFAASKKNAGVAFTINLDSIVGVKLYKFLTQTIRG